MIKICVITGSRAEYGLLYWLMKEIDSDPGLDLQIVAAGMHLTPQFGLTYKLIEEDGFHINKKVEMPTESDAAVDISKAVGVGVSGFAVVFNDLKPDLVVILGDRYEIFAAATAATIGRIPIAHIHGGESTEGAFDDALRHAITKMSYIHFAAADIYRKRIVQMGESPDRVFNVGALGLENIKKMQLLSKAELERSLEFTFGSPTFLVTYHPVTLENRSSKENVDELLKALNAFPNAKIIFTQSNADPDNTIIHQLILEKVKSDEGDSVLFESIGQRRYLSALNYVDVVIGNSSSGIIEVPAFKKPTVNIGDRQKGRLMASSIINCRDESEDIIEAIKVALSVDFRRRLAAIRNPYDSCDSSVQIKNILRDIPLDEGCLKKKFYDL